jgi:hypothetical protein
MLNLLPTTAGIKKRAKCKITKIKKELKEKKPGIKQIK